MLLLYRILQGQQLMLLKNQWSYCLLDLLFC